MASNLIKKHSKTLTESQVDALMTRFTEIKLDEAKSSMTSATNKYDWTEVEFVEVSERRVYAAAG